MSMYIKTERVGTETEEDEKLKERENESVVWRAWGWNLDATNMPLGIASFFLFTFLFFCMKFSFLSSSSPLLFFFPFGLITEDPLNFF